MFPKHLGSISIFETKLLIKIHQQNVLGTWNSTLNKIEKNASFLKLIVYREKANNLKMYVTINKQIALIMYQELF